MSNTNTEVLTTAYEKLQGAITQSNTVLPKLEEAVEKGNLDNYATVSQLEEKANKDKVNSLQTQINNLVVVGDGTQNAEVIQARCDDSGNNYSVLNSRLAMIERNINDINYTYIIDDYEIGSFSNGTEDSTSTNRLRTKTIKKIPDDSTIYITVNTGYYVNIAFLNDTTFKFDTGWITGDIHFNSDMCSHFRLLIKKEDNSDVTINDSEAVSVIVSKTDISKEILKITNIYRNACKKFLFFDWEIGGINNDGSEDNTIDAVKKKYRTKDKIKLDRDVVLTVGSTNKINISIFNDNNVFASETGWLTNTSYNVPAGTNFAITLQSIDTTQYSKFGQFLDVECYMPLYDKMDNNPQVTFEQGGIFTGTNGNSTNRIRSVGYIDFKDNDSMLIKTADGYKLALVAYDSSSNYLTNEDFGWVNSIVIYKYSDRKYRIIVKKDDNSNFNVSSTTAYVTVSGYNKNTNIYKAINTDMIQTIAHRGLSSFNEPENSCLAIKEASKNGRKYVEIDIKKTTDGKWVCIHDTTIDRVCDGTGNVSDFSLTELYTYNFNKGHDGVVLEKYATKSIKVSILEDILRTCKKFNVKLVLDCGSLGYTDILDVYNIVKEYDFINNTIWEFTAISSMIELHAMDKNCSLLYSTGTLTDNTLNMYRYFNECQCMITTQYTLFTGDSSTSNIQKVATLKSNGVYCMAFTLQKSITDYTTIVDTLIDDGIFAIGTNDFDMYD